LFDAILCNDNHDLALPIESDQWVLADEISRSDTRLYTADLVDYEHPWRHDPSRLAKVLMDLFYERTGPLEELHHN